MSHSKIVIIGATGNVGRKVVEIILQRKLVEPHQLMLTASPQSAGKTLSIAGHDFSIYPTQESVFANNQICLFNTESQISSYFIPHALQAGAYVVDSSSYYRLDDEVPLIIPPVNAHLVNANKKLYAHANCITSPIAVVLAPLHEQIGIQRVNAVTYQSTSGAGKQAMDECWLETKSLYENTPFQRSCFKRQIAFNVIPQVDKIREDGYTYEEFKIIHEIQKVIDHNIQITSTAVRVPVMIGHSVALSIEFTQPYELQEVKRLLARSPSIQLSEDHYATPIDVVGSDDVHVGRIRKDISSANSLHLWLCSDNLRRGAAVDAVEILSNILCPKQSSF